MTKKPTMSSRTALAYTVGMEPSEMSVYRYHPTRLTPCVYVFGNTFMCAANKYPRFSANYDLLNQMQWRQSGDQFWAAKANTTIWVFESK
jgi:hypothetical protein